MAVMQLKLDQEVEGLVAGIDGHKTRVMRAVARAHRKLLTWLNRQIARTYAAEARISQKSLKENKRLFSRKGKMNGSVWVGLNPLKAHWIAGTKQTGRGVKVGKQVIRNAFAYDIRLNGTRSDGTYGPKKTGRLIYFQRLPNGKLKLLALDVATEVAPQLNRLMPLAKQRFHTLLKQELNYALNQE